MGISRLKPSRDGYAKRLCQPPTKQNEKQQHRPRKRGLLCTSKRYLPLNLHYVVLWPCEFSAKKADFSAISCIKKFFCYNFIG